MLNHRRIGTKFDLFISTEQLGFENRLNSEKYKERYSNLGKEMPILYAETIDSSEYSARKLGVSPVYPSVVGFDPDLSGKPIGAYQTDIPESGIMIYFNPDITYLDKNESKLIAAHEAVHLNQKGKDFLSQLYVSIDGYDFPFGLAMLEGGAEYIVEEKHGRSSSVAYSHYKSLAKMFDKKLPLRHIYETAEHNPEKLISELTSTIRKNKSIQEELYKSAKIDSLLSLNEISKN